MSDQEHLTHIWHGDPKLRSSDAEREAIAARLRAHHADGRLDTAELQDRIDGCYQAKTLGELKQLLADLPGETARPQAERDKRWRLPVPLIALVPVLLALAAIGAVAHHHMPWIVIPVLFIAARLILCRRRRWGMRGWGMHGGSYIA